MTVVSDWNKNIVEEFRSNEGKVGGQFEGYLGFDNYRRKTTRVIPVIVLTPVK